MGEDALALYYARDFAGAAARFEACAAKLPDDDAARSFLERSRAHARDGVRPSWTVFEAQQTK